MKKFLPFFIGLRYTRAKKQKRFVSFISMASVIGIALGVMVLITVLSVMNGFKQVVRHKFFAISPQVNVMSTLPFDSSRPILLHETANLPQVVGMAPYTTGEGMLANGPSVSSVQVMGVDPVKEVKISRLNTMLISGKYSSLQPGTFNALVGIKLLNRLGAQLGSTVTLYTTETSVTPLGVLPRFRRIHISGVFETNSGFGYDMGVVYMNLQDVSKLFPSKRIDRSGFHLTLKNIYDAQSVTQRLVNYLSTDFLVTNWTGQYGALFNALAMQKTIMFLVLLLIVIIAAFNLIVTLVMVVNDKRADIAILRTIGAPRSTVMSIFIFQGAIVGIFGTLVGVILGVALSQTITNLVNWIQHTFGVQWVSADVFWVNYLPSVLRLSDVLMVTAIALVLSVLSTLYPASLAFRTQPAEALRYE